MNNKNHICLGAHVLCTVTELGSETWYLDQQLEKKLLMFENMYLRRIINIPWSQTKATMRQTLSQPLITKVIKYRKWRYLGYVIRMPET